MAGSTVRRSGWVTFAAIVSLAAGGYNALSGLAAIVDDDTLANQAAEVLYGIAFDAWGWLWLLVGIMQLLTGVLLLQRVPAAFWLAVGGAFISAMLTVFVIFVFPLWAIVVLTLDFLVIYGLVTHSDEFE